MLTLKIRARGTPMTVRPPELVSMGPINSPDREKTATLVWS
jgi:hypothetical protein